MSKLGCVCGEVIRDQTDYLPYKASLIVDEDDERFRDGLLVDLVALVTAVRDGTAAAWTSRGPLPPLGMQRDLPSTIHALLAVHLRRYQRDLYQCDACGRLLVQQSGADQRFLTFSPDDDGAAGLLRSALGSPLSRG